MANLTAALRRSPELGAGLFLVLLVTLAALFAPKFSPYDPNAQNLKERLKPPAWEQKGEWAHPLGTDQVGRDTATRIMYGARVSLIVGISSVAIAGVIGSGLGVAAGYFGRKVDSLIMRLADVQLGFPVVLLAILLVATFGTKLWTLIGVLALSGWVIYARTMRSVVLQVKEQDFVEASHALGAPDSRIIFKHILPHLFAPFMVVATVQIGQMVLLESALSFLGMGVQPPTASWGLMIVESKSYVFNSWWLPFFPGFALALFVLGTNLVGDGWRDLHGTRLGGDEN